MNFKKLGGTVVLGGLVLGTALIGAPAFANSLGKVSNGKVISISSDRIVIDSDGHRMLFDINKDTSYDGTPEIGDDVKVSASDSKDHKHHFAKHIKKDKKDKPHYGHDDGDNDDDQGDNNNDQGDNNGYDNGFNNGYNNGFNNDFNNGYNNGYNNDYNNGYNNGYIAAQEDKNN